MIRRQIPGGGLQVWLEPDPARPPVATLPAGHEVELLEETAHGWARVRWAAGQEGWVDGRQLVATGATTPAPGQPPAAESRWRWVIAVAVLALVGAGVVAGVLLTQDDGDDTIVAAQSGETGADPSDESGDAEPSDQPTGEEGRDEEGTDQTEPTEQTDPEPEDEAEPPEAVSFSDPFLEEVLADAAANPLGDDVLPARDEIATTLLVGELEAGGFDLTGMEIVVYPAASVPAFVLMATDDSTALVNDDGGAETFVPALLASPSMADAGVERLVLRHRSADDAGPFVITMTVPLSDLQEALDTGADVFDRIAVQVERE